MSRRLAALALLLLFTIGSPASALAQSGPLGPLPAPAPEPVELPQPDNGRGDDDELTNNQIILIGIATIGFIAAIGLFISRDARKSAPDIKPRSGDPMPGMPEHDRGGHAGSKSKAKKRKQVKQARKQRRSQAKR